MEAHEHGSFFRDFTHRQTGTMTVSPCRAVDRCQNLFRADSADMPQGVHQNLLLHGHLSMGLEMLHGAASAAAVLDAEVRALRQNAKRGFLINFGCQS